MKKQTLREVIEPQFTQYCSNCGRGLIRVPVPANKAKYWDYDFLGDIRREVLGTKYNKETGLRQFGTRVMCPNARWYNRCTKYVDRYSLHDSNLPELINLI